MRLLLFSLALFAITLYARAAERVDLQLVLALDASSSVDQTEYALQLGGVASALRDPSVLAAIRAGPQKRIAVNVLIWARPSDNKQTTGWRVIASAADADSFATEIVRLPRLQGGGTGIGEGIRASLLQLRTSGYESFRKVIDVSGDGRESFVPLEEMGQAITLPFAHQIADRMGVIVNGLAIAGDDPGLLDYYLNNVRHGPGSFAIPAKDYQDFARAMKLKLLREIGALPVAMLPSSTYSRVGGFTNTPTLFHLP